MKALHYLLIPACLTFLSACSHTAKPAVISIDSITNHLKPGKHCYIAVFEKDTARLQLDITSTGQITGRLLVNYEKNADTVIANRQPTQGSVTAQFKGDTLIGDYRFTSGANGKTIYTNPVALLHKGDSLIMGYGSVYTYLGRSYFDPQTPVKFSKSKFHFAPVDCKH